MVADLFSLVVLFVQIGFEVVLFQTTSANEKPMLGKLTCEVDVLPP